MGTSVSSWQSSIGEAKTATGECSKPDACFGPRVANTSNGQTFEFTSMNIKSQTVAGYQMNFATGSDLSTVRKLVMHTLPADSKWSAMASDDHGGSCAIYLIHSHLLAKALGGPAGDTPGVVGLELSSTGSQGKPEFSATNIQWAYVISEAGDASASC
jgi:hypothetical protein